MSLWWVSKDTAVYIVAWPRWFVFGIVQQLYNDKKVRLSRSVAQTPKWPDQLYGFLPHKERLETAYRAVYYHYICNRVCACTVFARSDTVATIYFIGILCVASVWERRLVESGVYLLQPHWPLPCFKFWTRHACAGAIGSILGVGSTREWRLLRSVLLVVRRQFDSGK